MSDIRSYFSVTGQKSKPGARIQTTVDPSISEQKNVKKGRASSKPKASQKRKSSISSEDNVQIIVDSDEEFTGKIVNGRNYGNKTKIKYVQPKDAKEQDVFKSKHSKSKDSGADVKMNPAIVEDESKSEVLREISKRNKSSRKQVISDSEESPVKHRADFKARQRSEESAAPKNAEQKNERHKQGRRRQQSRLDSDEEILPKKMRHRMIDSDSDEEDPLPKKKLGRKRKKEAVVNLDSSDEEEKPHSKQKGTLDAFVTPCVPNMAKVPESKEKSAEKRKAICATDYFGEGPVRRTEKDTVKTGKRKVAETVDTEFHDDVDFTKTLELLDKQEAKKPRKETTPVKEKKPMEKGVTSFASKLSMKMKTASPEVSPLKKRVVDTVPETPDVRRTPRKGRSSGTSSPFGNRKAVEVSKTLTELESFCPDKKTPPKERKKLPETPRKGRSNMSSPVKRNSPRDITKTLTKMRPSSVEKKTPLKAAENPPKGESGKSSAKKNLGAYRSYLNREGPKALGSKEIPTGADNCLEGLTFVITGVLESLDRDDAKSLVERYGGKVTGNVSSRTSYVVVGRDPGASKITKAEQYKTKQLDEDGLLDLIRTKPGKKSKYEVQAEQAVRQESLKKASSSTSQFTALKQLQSQTPCNNTTPVSRIIDGSSGEPVRISSGVASLMWVDKHKPNSLKQIIGQQGDKSNANKLLKWIQNWHKNRAAGVKPMGRFYGQDDGSGHRAALLSGPPGIGKTTTAVLVCKEAGFSAVELNASDKRSKRSLKEEVAEALDNKTMVDYMGEQQGPVTGHKHCLIMDEVDGMAGNEDRGGLQELVQLIKNTKIPVICICNDRNSIKMRTLANYCFDLRFQRPRLEQIKGALLSIAYKEGLKISPPAMQEIILSSNQDIRQCIHNMSMWTANNKELTYDQAKQDAKKAEKDIHLGIFDVARKIFAGGEETSKMTISDKSDLFFQDYSFVPLFVHENYIDVAPFAARGDQKKLLSLLARTAESICDGDLVDRQIRGNNSWNLLPIQAMFASVIPGEYMRGSISHMIRFPAWLGKNSSTGKNDRILQELRAHMALQVSGDKRSLNLDYLPAFRLRLTEPLAKLGSEGVPQVIKLMDDYDIVKDDYDNILEITKWPNSKDLLACLESKTKAAFTRQYNKECHLTPYATGAAPKKKRGRGSAAVEEDYGEGAEGTLPEVSDSEEEDNVETDTMIKASKKEKPSSSKGKTSKGKGKTSKGKGNTSKVKGTGKVKSQR